MVKKLVFLLCVALLASPALGAVLDLRITNGIDDAEEHLADGAMDITSTDLEFPYEDNGNPSATDPQLNFVRFVSVAIPKGAQVTKAYLEFEMDETKGNDKPVNVIVEGQLTPDAPAVANVAKNLSSRAPWTAAKVKWTVPTGQKVDVKFQSPDLSAIVNELISQDGWAGGNALALVIRDDPDNPSTGLCCVESVEGEAAAAPLLHIEVFIPQATSPDPADGAPAVNLPLLAWTAGDGAVAHNVYVGTSPELTAANLVGPAQPVTMYYHAPGLEPGVTYYWRVDEVDAAGTVYTGAVWQFTAEPVTAWGPTPADAAVDVFPAPTLSWTAGAGAVEHQVFLSANRFDVILGAAEADKGKTAEAKFDTGLLALGTTYYWRVDEIQADGKAIRGLVWSFTTAEALELRIAGGTDDAEEHLNAGMDITSTDLEIVHEDAGTPATDEQLIGVRWLVPITKETVIAKAYVEFQLKEIKTTTNDAPVNVIIEGQLDPNPAAFTTTAKDISSRIPTKAQVAWTIPTGMAVDSKFQTPDISPILAELVSQEGWVAGNAVVITIRDDKSNPSTGLRCVYSYNGSAAAAPLLHVEPFKDPATQPAAAPKATILWVSDAYDDAKDGIRDDQSWIDLLTAQGYNVDYRMGAALGNGFWRTLDAGKIEALNAADLIVSSRNFNSGDYNNGNERDQWNGVTTPLIGMSMHVVRSSHWKWFNTTTIPNAVALMRPADATHGAFTGVTVDPNGQIAALDTRNASFPGTKDAGNGTVIATRADTGDVWIAKWDAGTEFYAGAGQIPAGPRVFFAAGTQEVVASGIGRGDCNLTDSGKAVFLNIVDMLLP